MESSLCHVMGAHSGGGSRLQGEGSQKILAQLFWGEVRLDRMYQEYQGRPRYWLFVQHRRKWWEATHSYWGTTGAHALHILKWLRFVEHRGHILTVKGCKDRDYRIGSK